MARALPDPSAPARVRPAGPRVPPDPDEETRPDAPGTGPNVCPACRGTGQIEGMPCGRCRGMGSVTAG